MDASRLPGPRAQAKAAYRFKGLLTRCDVNEGETLHGIRGGAAAEGLLRRGTPGAVAMQAGWKGISMVEYYTSFNRIGGACVFLKCLIPPYSALIRLNPP